jgi:hypothetical protein
MAKKRKPKFNTAKAIVSSGLYAVRGTQPKLTPGPGAAVESRETGQRIERAKRMAAIEAYAKQHRVTIAQAMIHFM